MTEPLYVSDPDAYRRKLKEGNAKQAKKIVVADGVFRDSDGRILLVDPNYKAHWDLPGGMSESNEAPDETLRRELAEELGLHLPPEPPPLLVVEWVPRDENWDDKLMFVFDGGILTGTQIAALRLTDDELDNFGFFTPDRARELLRTDLGHRLDIALEALDSRRVYYVRDTTN
ncbi:NUDIX hydrolase [Nocardia sp. BMG51109]|uniref:NUDIX domain-containing protein n=1 Tax=Nocardia sp. BMG51109 TaxID=1056816 RepID=UPI0004666470|nr:NUDIX hydrolase [Nocardia sp. BMG51109]